MRFLSFLSSCVAASVVMAALAAADARAEFTPQVGWDQQLFPSYLIATATVRPSDNAEESETKLGDPRGLIGIEVVAPSDDCPITVTVAGEPAFESSTFSGVLPTEGETYRIYPRIKYDYAALAANKQSVPLAVHFSVEIGEEDAEEETVTATLRSVNDCPYTIGGGENAVDVSFTFAAYVNEQHPYVEKILREALNEGIVDSFTGYQSADPTEVYRQVYALWDALTKRDVRYADITVEAAENQVVSSQHVRLIDESINNAQANCVDGSVLLASLLRKVGIEPMLVFLPRHCYLGFYLDSAGKQPVFIETTLVGSQPSEELPKVAGLKDVVDAEQAKAASWGTFVEAIAAGNADYTKHRKKFAAADDPNYQLVPIAPARQQGILPIAFAAGDDFVPAEKVGVRASADDEEDEE
jgi:hypothetical protein